jgi:hypothetical protein
MLSEMKQAVQHDEGSFYSMVLLYRTAPYVADHLRNIYLKECCLHRLEEDTTFEFGHLKDTIVGRLTPMGKTSETQHARGRDMAG